MARFYAQIFTLIFFAVGVGGLFLGDAGHLANGVPGGNLGPVDFQLTWARDAADIAVALVLAYIGFIAGRRTGRIVVGVLGVILLLATVIAMAGNGRECQRVPSAHSEKVSCAPALGPLRFTVPIDVLDIVAGGFGILAALGTVEAPEPPVRPFLS